MPKWIARSAGIAARNGTSSHTVTYTAATAGNFLLAIVGGGVTNTMVTSGWTERLQPVNNTELSIFTKDSASASESSFQVNHNASNYPVNYAVYQFPPGSSYLVGTSSANANSWPTLSGITGTPTIFAVLSEIKILAADGTYVATWNTPWTEDIDSDTDPSTIGATEGDWLTVAYQDDYASASVTPSHTDNTGRTDERAVFGIYVPPTYSTPLNDNSYNIRDMTDFSNWSMV